MAYTNYLLPSAVAASFNSTSLGDISDKGAKIRTKEKHLDFGPTQECAGLTKRIPILSGIEAEFEIDDCDVDTIGKTFGYNTGVSGDTMVITIGQQLKAAPYSLVINTQDPDGSARRITITNMIPSSETVEMIYNRKVQSRVPFKFVSCGVSVLTIDMTP